MPPKVRAELSKNLSEEEKEALLSFIIYNEKAFATSEDFFKGAAQKSFKDRDAKFLENKYGTMAVKCGLIDSNNKVIPAHKLNIEQKLKLTYSEKFELKKSFIKEHSLGYCVMGNLSTKIQGMSLADNKTGESTNAPKSSISTSQPAAVATPISAGERGRGEAK
ncbi:hypothetical protein B9Z55_026813 [Caenorhabditis nigoni]|uniref:Uncharacterized protein n=1 Tax=Caenorhabditis nigoni TaxID=1611254 RepID=A0A2G5SI56_9PELO|nr:hypothetical protein B9Z55_026813 [Caenorhabditis nigoni]